MLMSSKPALKICGFSLKQSSYHQKELYPQLNPGLVFVFLATSSCIAVQSGSAWDHP